jgi:hypothetical protein
MEMDGVLRSEEDAVTIMVVLPAVWVCSLSSALHLTEVIQVPAYRHPLNFAVACML